jgi:hypothetical protein
MRRKFFKISSKSSTSVMKINHLVAGFHHLSDLSPLSLGQKINKMGDALSDNNNLLLELHVDNFFTLKFYKRRREKSDIHLTSI